MWYTVTEKLQKLWEAHGAAVGLYVTEFPHPPSANLNVDLMWALLRPEAFPEPTHILNTKTQFLLLFGAQNKHLEVLVFLLSHLDCLAPSRFVNYWTSSEGAQSVTISIRCWGYNSCSWKNYGTPLHSEVLNELHWTESVLCKWWL